MNSWYSYLLGLICGLNLAVILINLFRIFGIIKIVLL